MKQISTLLLVFTLFFGCNKQALSQQLSNDSVKVLYYYGHSNILNEDDAYYMASLSTYVKQLRSKYAHQVLLLHGGQAFFPSQISLYDQGQHIVSLANLINVNALSLGPTELVYGTKALSERANEARFPIISSNVLDKHTNQSIKNVVPIYQVQVGTKKIAIAASVFSNRLIMPNSADRPFARTNGFINQDKIESSLKSADVSILMTTDFFHWDNDKPQNYAELFDVVLGYQDNRQTKQKNAIPILPALGKKNEILLVEIDKNEKITHQYVDLTYYEHDPDVLDYINQYKTHIGRWLDTPLAETTEKFDTRLFVIRSGNNHLANIYVDAIREFAQTDFAILNAGAFKAARIYPQKHIMTRLNVHDEMAFGHSLKVIQMKGHEIKEMMEHSLSRYSQLNGRFLHVSGMTVKFNPNKPVNQRINSIKVNGEDIVPYQNYSLALSDYLLNGGDEYTLFLGKKNTYKNVKPIRFANIVANYLIQKESIAGPPNKRLVLTTN